MIKRIARWILREEIDNMCEMIAKLMMQVKTYQLSPEETEEFTAEQIEAWKKEREDSNGKW